MTYCCFSVGSITLTNLSKGNIFFQVDTLQILSKVLFKRAHFLLWYNVIVKQGERISVNDTGCQRWHFKMSKNTPQNGLWLPNSFLKKNREFIKKLNAFHVLKYFIFALVTSVNLVCFKMRKEDYRLKNPNILNCKNELLF